MPRAPFPKIQGSLLRDARKRAGLNVGQLASLASTEGLYVCPSSVQAWELESYGPSEEKLAAIARVLKMRPEQLLKSSGLPI